MPRRVHICPIDGTGTDDDPFRARVYGRNHGMLAIDGSVGYAVVIVDTEDHKPLIDDTEVDNPPEAPLDVTIGSLKKPDQRTVEKIAEKRGITVSLDITMREFIARLARRIDPDFDQRIWSL